MTRRLGRGIAAATERLKRLASLHESETYCLQCFERMNRSERTCDSCGFGNFRAMRRKYWNLNPAILRLQLGARVFSVLASVLVCAWFAFGITNLRMGRHSVGYIGMGYLVIVPITVCVALWKTSGKMTMHLPYFRATVFWVVACLISGWWFVEKSPVAGYSFLGIAVLIGCLGRGFRNWKLRKCGLKIR